MDLIDLSQGLHTDATMESRQARVRLLGGLTAREVFSFSSIIAVALLAYWPSYAPAIFMDDWTSVVERVVTGNAAWFDLDQGRALLFTPFLLQHRILGINITAYYMVLWSLYVLMALLIYQIAGRFPLEQKHWFALVVALLFLVYPTNYTHMWLIQLGVYCSVVLTLAYAYLTLRFAQEGRWGTLALGLVCLLLSLGLYEAQVGVCTAWPLVLGVICHSQSNTKRIGLFLPIVLMITFSIWRTLGYRELGISDQYLSQIVVTPATLWDRLVLGYKISLAWGWTTLLGKALPWVSGTSRGMLLVLGFISTVWLSLRFIVATRNAEADDATSSQRWSDHRLTIYRPYLTAVLVGVVLVGAGYIPVIAVYLPSLSGVGSRFNIYGSLGGSVVVASSLLIGAVLCSKNGTQVKYLFIAAAVPFLLLGLVTQVVVQHHNRVAWQEQKDIWRQLFSAAPRLKGHTMVLFVLTGEEDRTGFQNWRRTPLSASWEASSAVRLLYNDFTLSADVYFTDIDEPNEPTLTTEGILSWQTDSVVPYSRTVAFLYDDGEMRQLEELAPEMVKGGKGPVNLCTDCIEMGEPRDAPLRVLVQN